MTRLFVALILLAASAVADPSVTVAVSPDAPATEAVVQMIGETG